MSNIPTTEPTEIVAGDTIKWTKTIDDYPADLFVLKYKIVPLSGGAPLTVAATADGTDHSIIISAADSAGFTAGDYRWFSYAVDLATSAERYMVDGDGLVVLPDPTASSVADLRSKVRQIYDAINATILGEASDAQLKIVIDGDSLEKKTAADLLALESRYRLLVQQEEQAEKIKRGLRPRNRILTRC